MSSKEIYRKKFEEILHIEEKFIPFYRYYLDRVKDPAVLGKLKEIYAGKGTHIVLMKNFLEIIDK